MLKLSKIRASYWQLSKTFKKLAAILANSMLITESCKIDYTFFAPKNSSLLLLMLNISLLKYALCIYYLFYFKKNWAKVQVLLYYGSEVNIIAPVYAASLNLKIRLINIRLQKIDDSHFSNI